MTGIVFALLTALFFGSMFVMVRLAWARAPSPEAGAIVINAAALAVALLAAIVARTDFDQLSLDAIWPFLAAGCLAPGLSQVLLLKAIGATGAARPAVVVGATPLLSTAAAILFLHEPLSLGFALGTAAIVCGAVVLSREGARPAALTSVGFLFALGSAAAFASRDNLVRWGIRGTTHVPPLLAASALLTAATATTLVYGVAVRGPALTRSLADAVIPYLPAGIAIGLAYVCLSEALARIRVTVAAPLIATQTLWAAAFAAIVLRRQEAIGRRLALATLLILAGAAVVGATHS
jgi:drug/metabolite transporter (DMT)-like permease